MQKSKAESLYRLPLMDLLQKARETHKKHFRSGCAQASHLCSIKTGGCSEDCAYCAQSARYPTKIKREKLLNLETVIEKAKAAKLSGASRFCMGAGWREVKEGSAFERILEMVKAVHKLGLEVCCTLGMLNLSQAKRLKQAGLFAYNHNIDTSPEFYPKIVRSHSYQDRIETIQNVKKAGLSVCTGGILGLGESTKDRISFIQQLEKIQPESITINNLIPIKGSPLENQKPISALITVRVIAICRVLMPKALIRLSAGRLNLSAAEQFLCFYAGANSIFIGERLLTTKNPDLSRDKQMLEETGMRFVKNPDLKRSKEQLEEFI